MDKDTGLDKDTQEKPKSKAGARARKSEKQEKQDRPAEAVGALLKKVEEQLTKEQLKPTLADYIRLRQLYRELEDEEPREIKVTWVDKSTKPDTES